jgi:hypothetical protein
VPTHHHADKFAGQFLRHIPSSLRADLVSPAVLRNTENVTQKYEPAKSYEESLRLYLIDSPVRDVMSL